MKTLIIILMSFLTINCFASPVNINAADAKTIADALNGIGPSKAEAIIKYREEHGPFKTAEDLLEVSGIGDKTLEKIKPDLLFDNNSNAEPSSKASKPKN